MSVKLNLVNVYLRSSILLVYINVRILSHRHYCHEVSSPDRFSRLQVFSHRWNRVNYNSIRELKKIRKRNENHISVDCTGDGLVECFILNDRDCL